MRYLIIIFASLTLFHSIATPLQAFDIRSTFYNPQVYTGTAGGPATLSAIYNPILRLVYILGGLMVMIGFIYGGFIIIANSGNPQKVAEGQNIITKTLLGLIVLISVYWIVQIVELLTGMKGQITNPTL